MARAIKIQFNVNQKEQEKLKRYAEKQGLSVAEILRDFIKSLPDSK
jgi:ABC-type uncharacterized transport system substrate-binding protein